MVFAECKGLLKCFFRFHEQTVESAVELPDRPGEDPLSALECSESLAAVLLAEPGRTGHMARVSNPS